MAYKVTNNAFSTLAGSISNSATSLSVAIGHGDRFPVITGADYTYITLEDVFGNIEIVKVTARASTSNTMTIVRGQDGTTGRNWASGDIVELRIVATLLDLALTHIDDLTNAHVAGSIGVTPFGTLIATNVQSALQELDTDLTVHIVQGTDAHDASAISYLGSTNISATNVEAALDELDTDLTVHIVQGTDAHDASAISYLGSTNISATNVEAALDELDIEKTTLTEVQAVLALTPSGFKNKIIGGDFSLNPWQRGTSFPGLSTGQYVADRWTWNAAGGGIVTVAKTADAPTALQAGVFTQHCLHADVTTIDASIAAGDFYFFEQKIEGYNAASFGFGQAGTRNVTLSFWVKGGKTGIHCVALRNGVPNRSYVAEYTISAINTWEYKKITIPVDTAGTWLYDNGVGLQVDFTAAVGSTYQTTANNWQTGSFIGTANQVNEMDSIANDFKVDLVQLEPGSTATAFESKDAGDVMRQCYRYAEPLYYNSSTIAVLAAFLTGTTWHGTWTFKVNKRALPTLTLVSGAWVNTTPVINPGLDFVDFSSSTTFFYAIGTAGNTALLAVAEL